VYVIKHSLRFIFVISAFFIFLAVFSTKLILIQVFRSDHLAKLAEKQQNYSIKIEPIRGTIYDRNMKPLAMNVSVYSLYANPRLMDLEAKTAAIQHLTAILNVDQEFIKARLDRKKYFVWLARKLPSETVSKIKSLDIVGLDFINESKRYYPNQSLAAHVIGFAGVDNVGLEGIELSYNRYLGGQTRMVAYTT